jgi:RHS repeat-associated protein
VGAGFAGRVVQIIHPEVDDGTGTLIRPVEQFNYNQWGQIESEIDPRGAVTRYIYSQGTAQEASGGANPLFAPGVTPAPGLLTQVIEDYGGQNLTQTYKAFDAAGNPGLAIGPGGHNATAYVYDPMNRIAQETDAVGVVTTYAYDGRGNLVQEVVDAGGRDVTTSYEFNAEDQLVRQQVEDGLLIVKTSFKYDVNQQPALVEDSLGNQSIYIYDNADQLINVIDPAGFVVTYTYALDGQPASMVDADGYTRRYEYDAFDRKVAEVSDESGLALTTEFSYDLNGNLLTTTDPAGTTTCFSYDALNRLASRTIGCGGENLTTSYALDLNGNVLRVTDHRGVITRHEYDALDRQVSSFLDADGLNLEIRFGYDAAGNLAETRDMRGTVTQLSFDELNRVTQQCEDVDGLNLCSQSKYDSLGNQETTTDPNGIVTLTTFNGFGRPIEIVRDMGGLGATTNYSYDNNLNTASVTDANGNSTHYAYTFRNELAEERFADGTLVSHLYNGRGFVATQTNQDSTTIAHEYDGAGRMIGRVFSDGGVQQATYDGAGRITSASQTMDGHTTSLSRDYNGLGDVISETQSIDGRRWALSYDHDYLNGVYTLTYPSGTQTVHATDALARVDDIRNHLGQTVADYGYDDVSGQRSLGYANGVTTLVEFDPLNRVSRIQSAVADYQYGYDQSGNRSHLKRGHLPGQPADVYQYDGLYRPTQVWYGADSTDPGSISTYDRQQSFDLDLLSNRLQMNDDGALIDYAPSDGQQLANSMNRYETVDGRTHAYDLRGNTLSDGVITYTYDILNRQIGIDGPSNDAQYVFNPFGYRVATIVDGTITYFVYDNQGQVLEERDGSDLLLARYTYGPGIDIPVTLELGATTYYYHRDAQNSITEITDSAGDLVERYSYDIYGQVTIYDAADNVLTTSGIGNPYLYTGRRLDAESGNYYFRARVYSPELGRFLQMDPLGYVDGQNLYASYFVINGTDPNGTSALFDLLADLNASLPDINVSAGISIEAKSPPILGPVGVFGKMETKFTLGTCCEQGKIKNFVQHDVVVMVGFHVGLPGIFVSPAIQTKITTTKCPKEGPFSCQGVVSVNVSAGPVSGACSMKWDGSWSCGASLFGFGGDYGSSGLSGAAGGSEDLINNQGIPPTKLGLSVSGGIDCSKVEVT